MFKKRSTSSHAAIAFTSCPAKTYVDQHGHVCTGRTVFNHCQIVGAVARQIIRLFPEKMADQLFPPGSEVAAAAHDIGKVSPAFYDKLMRACVLPQLGQVNPDLERNWGGHAGVSQLTANFMNAPEYVSLILGQHHGFSPNLSGMRATDENFGGTAWQKERERLVAALHAHFSETWPQVETAAQARLLAGLTSVSDWIGSGAHFENPHTPWEARINQSLEDAGFVPVSVKKSLRFSDVFPFEPNQAQKELIEQVKHPGVYILEAPMGMGKTEAALFAAYHMLQTDQSRGIYFALPTQLTSNKIFERFQPFLEKILSEDCKHRPLLLHANAWLLETDMGEEGRPGGAWFSQSKRGLLAPFAVGTLDQALMAAMNVKHGFVRAFGLAGKVVILDEVHTYDAYTSTLLEALITLLEQLQCTVIILTATLTRERRRQLLDTPVARSEYPLISVKYSSGAACVREIPVPPPENATVQITLCRDEHTAIEEALQRAEQGQQVLWIENTVKDAQQRYLDLAARGVALGIECGLLHSRFTAADRRQIEEKWVTFFGKEGKDQRHENGRILIGTQVLEQSLDIDADFLVSRFAPTDMLLQRLGRLWRHEGTPRCTHATREAWFIAPPLESAILTPTTAFGASAFVYSPYILCRSLEAWDGINQINLPGDIRQLIEQTYSDREEQDEMARWLHELEHGDGRRKGRTALAQLARIGLAEGGKTLPESKAQTRYSETENYDVLILKRVAWGADKATLILHSGERVELPLQRYQLQKSEWRKRAAQLMRHIVNVPLSERPKPVPITTLKRMGLQHCFYLGNLDWPDDESTLSVLIIDDTECLRGVDNVPVHDKYRLEYRSDLGYRVMKNRE